MIEILIIAVLVIWSCIIVFKKVLPKTANKVLRQISDYCNAKGWNGLAKWLMPKAAGGCGGNCGCGSEDQSQKQQEIKTVKWK